MTKSRNNLQNRITDAALSAGRNGVTAPGLRELFCSMQTDNRNVEHHAGPRIASIQAAIFSLCKSHVLVATPRCRGGASVYVHTSYSGMETGETMTQAAQDRGDIYAHRPLVSIPKVAPLRVIPAWSRLPR